MVTCELDKEVSGEVLGYKLPTWQALLLHRVLPSSGGLVVYIMLMCFDFAIVFEYYKNKEDVLATFCVILIIVPALISMIFTLASPPDGLRPEDGDSINLKKKDIKWIIKEIVICLTFPVATIGRYCYLIFWWVEAVFAAYDEDQHRSEEALSRAHTPSSLELYLFLQSFLHAAPHCIVSLLHIMGNYNVTVFDTVVLQAVSCIVSCMRMASTATVYRRFQREKICGRKYPWYVTEIDTSKDENDGKKLPEPEAEPIYETIQIKPEEPMIHNRSTITSDFIKFSPSNPERLEPFFEDSCSDSSSNYLPPVNPRVKKNSQTSSGFNSEDEYARPISIIDKVAPLRRDTQCTIERVYIPTPPKMLAPRPGSLAVWAEKMVENAESIPGWLSAPTRHRRFDEQEGQNEPDGPRRKTRFTWGIEPQDVAAALVQYLGWYSFFVARLLSIACFLHFFSFAAIIVLFSHYQIMLLLLIVPKAPTVKRVFYIFLAFIYMFCLMEFKIRFKHVRVWHVFWALVCTIEIILFTTLWASIDNKFDFWWINFVMYVIFISMLLSYMCFLVYFVLLKPREIIVYIKDSEKTIEK